MHVCGQVKSVRQMTFNLESMTAYQSFRFSAGTARCYLWQAQSALHLGQDGQDVPCQSVTSPEDSLRSTRDGKGVKLACDGEATTRRPCTKLA
jgi:hypothetical protein